MSELWHTLTIENVFENFKTPEQGLTEEEAEIRLKQYGLNKIKEVNRIKPWKIFLEQINSLLIYLLLAASVISALIGHWLDFSLILAIIFLNSFLGFFQQYRAEKAIQGLKRMLIPTAKIMRQGKIREINAELLVPGDILILNEGDKIMADARLFYAENLQVDEAILTGESMPAEKATHEIRDSVALGDKINMIFLGTNVERGTAKAIITATGMSSEFGKIALMLQQPESEQTPLQQKLNLLGKQLGITAIILMLLILGLGILAGINKFEMFLTSVSLAVAAIPEGLPAVITLCLAFAVKRMLKVKALIRKLPAAETLGRVTVICSDKTGTITKEELKVVKVFCDGRAVNVGSNFLEYLQKTAEARLLMKVGCMSSNVRLEISRHDDGTEKEYLIGDATEKALLRTAKEFGFNKESLTHAEPRLKEFAFTSERKMMSIIRKGKDMRIVSYAKGSPEVILQRCNREIIGGKVIPLTEERKKHLSREYAALASEALRVLAFSYKFLPPYKENVSEQEAEYGMVFVGFQAIFDSPREEVREAVEKCSRAGIAVKMITGDSLVTARAVAKQIGLRGEALEGRELRNMEDSELLEKINEIVIFARVDPSDKVRIISLLKQKKEIVAITGDGVNDAPALRKADIGIAMGVRGSDVTREVADIVLLDDNFASIVKAVEEGRRIYDNIKKFTYYLLSTNLAEILIIFFALLVGLKLKWQTLLPLLPLQILWINLVSDGIIAITISKSHAEKNIMHRKPEKGAILTPRALAILTSIAAYITIIILFFFARNINNPAKAQTIAFTMLVLFEGFNAFNFSSFTEPAHKRKRNYMLIGAVLLTFLMQIAIIYLGPLQKAFHTTAISLKELAAIGIISVSILAIGELFKLRLSQKEKII